jgi:hypothetical protein
MIYGYIVGKSGGHNAFILHPVLHAFAENMLCVLSEPNTMLGDIARMTKLPASTVAGSIALGFFIALFFTSLATAAFWYYLIYGVLLFLLPLRFVFGEWNDDETPRHQRPVYGLWLLSWFCFC